MYAKILTYHTNPLGCGIAKFNHLLSGIFNAPVCPWSIDALVSRSSLSLLSINLKEFSLEDTVALMEWLNTAETNSFDLFLHGFRSLPDEHKLCRKARKIFCGNEEILHLVQHDIPDLEPVLVFCPGMIRDKVHFENNGLRLFSFGMAHKLQKEYFFRIFEILNREGYESTLRMSTALHEGTSFDSDFEDLHSEMKSLFLTKAYFLGFLSDEAVFNEIQQADLVLAFFSGGGVRANNTSVMAAMEAGAVVVTNFDRFSPPEFIHGENILDVDKLSVEILNKESMVNIGRKAAKLAEQKFSWRRLSEVMMSALNRDVASPSN